jgi:hypothetical protein
MKRQCNEKAVEEEVTMSRLLGRNSYLEDEIKHGRKMSFALYSNA